MKEQRGINANTFKRRASLPPEEHEYSASRYHVGTRTGMHPEDRPYITTTRSYHAPTTATYFEPDELDEREFTIHAPTSARRYAPPPGTYVQGNTRYNVRYEAPPRQRSQPTQQYVYTDDIDEPTQQKRGKHWMVYLGLGMLVMLAMWVVGSMAVNWIGNKLDDMNYGYPRTFQINSVVGHSDSPQNPSHFIALNLNRHVEIIEFPGGNPAKARVFLGPTLVGDNQELTPITLSFKDVTGNGKLDMHIHIQDQVIVMVNDNGTFRPTQQTDHIHL